MSRVSKAEFARICNVSPQAVSKWIKTGRIVADSDGMIDPEAAERMRQATESPFPHHQAAKAAVDDAKAHAHGVEKVSAALKLETYKLQKARAERENLELDKIAGLLVERSEVDYVLAEFGTLVRTLVEGQPDRLAGVLAAHGGDIHAIRKTLETAGYDLLNELADTIQRKMNELGK